MSLVFLLSHVPNPRIYKRMNLVKHEYNTSVIYWNRSFDYFDTFLKDKDINKYCVIDNDYNSYTISIWKRLLIIMKFMFKALKIMKKENPNIIHCEHLDMLFVAYVYKLIFNKNTKIVYEVADLHEIIYSNSTKKKDLLTKGFFIKIEKFLTKSISKLIITSPYFWEDYFREFIPKDKVIFIPNAPERRIFKEVSKVSNSELTIGFIGAVRYSEQLKMLIDVGKEIRLFNILIAGTGSSYEEIKEYVSGLDFVTMYGSYDYEKEVATLYSRVDIIYSVYDTSSKNVRVALPNRLYEAIVTERPIIVSRGTKLGEFVEKNKIGFLVDDNSKIDLANLMARLVKGSGNDLRSAKENCSRLKDKYFMDCYNNRLLKMYNDLSR